MGAQPRTFAGARHGVPLVADAAGIEAERKRCVGRRARRGTLRRDEARAPVGREKPAVAEEPRFALASRRAGAGHSIGIERVVSASDSVASAPMSKSRAPLFSKPDSAACSRNMSAGLL